MATQRFNDEIVLTVVQDSPVRMSVKHPMDRALQQAHILANTYHADVNVHIVAGKQWQLFTVVAPTSDAQPITVSQPETDTQHTAQHICNLIQRRLESLDASNQDDPFIQGAQEAYKLLIAQLHELYSTTA